MSLSPVVKGSSLSSDSPNPSTLPLTDWKFGFFLFISFVLSSLIRPSPAPRHPVMLLPILPTTSTSYPVNAFRLRTSQQSTTSFVSSLRLCKVHFLSFVLQKWYLLFSIKLFLSTKSSVLALLFRLFILKCPMACSSTCLFPTYALKPLTTAEYQVLALINADSKGSLSRPRHSSQTLLYCWSDYCLCQVLHSC